MMMIHHRALPRTIASLLFGVAVAGALLVSGVSRARAAANDLDLTQLVLQSPTPTFSREVHVPLFRRLVSEVGIAIAPVLVSPAETTGSLGFEIGFSTALTNIHESADYWRFAKRGAEAADGALALTTLHVRKGLPGSIELTGNAAWLARSELFAMGLEVKWAPVEGFDYVPDLAIRGSVNVGLGSRDFQIVTAGADISLSKAFAIGGTMSLTPYTGYNLLVINASSHVLDPTPRVAEDIEKNFVFAPETLLAHRFFAGMRLKTYFFTLTAAVELAFSDQIAWLQTYAIKLGFDF